MTEPQGGGPASGTFDVPKLGRVKKIYVYAGVGVVLVSAIVWYRNHHGTASTAGQATDPAGNVGQIDPATGFVYGSPEDVSALGAGSAPTGGGGASSGGGTSVGDQVSNGPPFTDNAAWDQYATTQLVGLGMDPLQVATDLGAYLAGEQVTVAQRDAVIVPAIGVAGPVPVAGPRGFPPSINLAAGGSNPGGGPPGAPSLSVGATTDTTVVVKWPTVSGASSYGWRLSDGDRHGTTGATSITLTALHPSTTYTVTVHANGSGGSGPDATITVKTRAASGGGGTTQPSGSYAAVTVTHYTTKNPPWNSYMGGIAQHYGYGSDWETIWNDPKNAGLRAKRHAPADIQQGDTVYVKRK